VPLPAGPIATASAVARREPDNPAEVGHVPGQAEQAAGQSADELVRDLYSLHALALIRLAKLLLRDQAAAEDAVQDAFFGLYRALPRLSGHGELLPYLRAAVLNRCRSELRVRRRAAARPVHHEPPESSAEYAAMVGEDRRAVLDAVGRLPRRAREVLVLRYYVGLTDPQIAATLGVSRGTVSSTATRALSVLGANLKEQL
jgi:RNA polymerase sigma-70 factor (sigma-E family)